MEYYSISKAQIKILMIREGVNSDGLQRTI